MIKLSIIITTYNRANLLEQLLNDILEQHVSLAPEEQSIELILVDNNSFQDPNLREAASKRGQL